MFKKWKKFGISSLALVLLAAAAFTGWSTKASAADASQIVSEMGAGWNLGNQLEAAVNGTPNETAWGNPTVTPELIKK